ncbi:MAG: type II toxin-antitoxin system RelE/ParE family toxin [Cytophagales bacterium]|jgi:mRNA interferase RelE/StbE|nr:type II toxin-antitoxin system RelE/ParE family toxin [Cytophagales bacterium]MCA6389670.1 type II toxin-antitoxin system RelE/ParE family toxin [Cytophagales bacterium]MCA6391176.1 type II toxin-antitoxin system RelE/ParE family toxin [Cytophagales bacterium]MCA6395814.1 type II toxin-antitoxin system RelE/ParE family toxin [Cytophagales bacterium]MCA6397679.1 type II toxin-antitoxin system RelE/ParE family toxin [Cytophagales bacterium]
MITAFKKSFLKSVQSVRDKKLRELIVQCINEVETASAIQSVSNIKRLKGHREYYRIRLGNYRIGLKVESDVVLFVVFENRKDIYKNFP